MVKPSDYSTLQELETLALNSPVEAAHKKLANKEVELGVNRNMLSTDKPNWQLLPSSIITNFIDFQDWMVEPLLKLLNGIIAVREFKAFWHYRKEARTSFSDELQTEYQAFCVIPLFRDPYDIWSERQSWYHGESHSCITIQSYVRIAAKTGNTVERGCSCCVSPYNYEGSKVSHRVCYSNSSHTMDIDHRGLLKIMMVVRDLQQTKAMSDLIKSVEAGNMFGNGTMAAIDYTNDPKY